MAFRKDNQTLGRARETPQRGGRTVGAGLVKDIMKTHRYSEEPKWETQILYGSVYVMVVGPGVLVGFPTVGVCVLEVSLTSLPAPGTLFLLLGCLIQPWYKGMCLVLWETNKRKPSRAEPGRAEQSRSSLEGRIWLHILSLVQQLQCTLVLESMAVSDKPGRLSGDAFLFCLFETGSHMVWAGFKPAV